MRLRVGACLAWVGGIEHQRIGVLDHSAHLHRRAPRAATTCVGVEQRLTGLALHDQVGHCIGVPLVRVAGPANTTGDLSATTLLHYMRGLVRRGVKIGRARERDVVTSRERHSAYRPRALGGLAVAVRPDVADVMATERSLDRIAVWQLGRRPTGTVRCRGMHRTIGLSAISAALHRNRLELRRQCLLTGRMAGRKRSRLGRSLPPWPKQTVHTHTRSLRFYVTAALEIP